MPINFSYLISVNQHAFQQLNSFTKYPVDWLPAVLVRPALTVAPEFEFVSDMAPESQCEAIASECCNSQQFLMLIGREDIMP